jgi:ABC-type molybdate transport system ATPase subunit
MFPDTGENGLNTQNNFDDLAGKLGLNPLLDLPLVALSNGQTRRARILKALLSIPELLLLDEPLSASMIIFAMPFEYQLFAQPV